MKLRSLIRAHDWVSAGVEFWWRLSTPEAGCAPGQMSPAPAHLEGVRIEWPSRYNWPIAGQWVDQVKDGLRHFVPVVDTDIPQPYDGIVVFDATAPGRRVRVTLDYWDYADRINEQSARESAVYFKMQCLTDGYGTPRIVPGQYVASKATIYRMLSHARHRRRRRARFDVYGRFGTRFNGELRRHAVGLLQDARSLRFHGGLNLVLWSRSLREAAAAKVCLDLPGNGDFCFRLVDYLAIGACVVAPRHRTTFVPPLEDRKHIVYCAADGSDLVELCTHYAGDEQARRAIEANAAEYFDRVLHKQRLGAYYLSAMLPALGRWQPSALREPDVAAGERRARLEPSEPGVPEPRREVTR